MKLYELTLNCSEEALEERWYKDTQCEWRIDEWLRISKQSLTYFEGLDTIHIDTSYRTATDVVDEIYELIVQ